MLNIWTLVKRRKKIDHTNKLPMDVDMMWMLVYLVIIVVLLIWIVSEPFYWKIRKVKHLFPLPIFGNCLPSFIPGNAPLQQYLYDKFPGEKYFGFHMFIKPMLFVKDPGLIHQMVALDHKHFSSVGLYIDTVNDPMSGHIYFAQGQRAKELREKVSKQITPDKTIIMLNTVESSIYKMISHIDANINKNQPIELVNFLRKISADIIYQATHSIETDTAGSNSIFSELGESIVEQRLSLKVLFGMITPKLCRLFKATFLTDKLNKVCVDIVTNIIQSRKKENIYRQDFIQGLFELMDENNRSEIEHFPDTTQVPRYDLKELIGIATGFALAGINTVSLTLAYCLYELARHPDIQEKCRRETFSVIEEKGTDHITANLATSLPFLGAVVKETCRIHSVATIIVRQCTKAYKIPETDCTIEKGGYVIFSSLPIHMDEKYFPEPAIFRPERFLNGGEATFKPGTYFPFGLGAKKCVAASFARVELNLLLSRLLQNFQFTVSAKTCIPMEYATFAFLRSPKGGSIWLNAQRIERHNKAYVIP